MAKKNKAEKTGIEEANVLCTLILNPETTQAKFDGDNFVINKTVKRLKKISKHIKIYKISKVEEKYLKLLTLNTDVLHLEYSLMEYFVLISNVKFDELKLPKGMTLKKGMLVDGKSTLNISFERESSNC